MSSLEFLLNLKKAQKPSEIKIHILLHHFPFFSKAEAFGFVLTSDIVEFIPGNQIRGISHGRMKSGDMKTEDNHGPP